MEQTNPHRQNRIAETVERAVGEIILDSAVLDGAMTTISGIVLSPKREHATLRVSILPEGRKEEVIELLKEKTWHIQQALNKKLRMRPVPKIRFELDNSEEGARRILDILEKEALEH